VRNYAQNEPRYMCWAQEVGDQGTPHLQGYVAWDNPRSLNKFKDAISNRLHYEAHTRGTAQQNRNYCLGMVEKKGFKENPTFEEVGEMPEQGERTDWKNALTQLDSGNQITEVVQTQPQLLPTIRALERFYSGMLSPSGGLLATQHDNMGQAGGSPQAAKPKLTCRVACQQSPRRVERMLRPITPLPVSTNV
jgi:hypothetical protein